MTKKVAFYTIGCKLNFSESSTFARQFEQGEFSRTARGEKPDVCIINTCSVTDHADKKCRNVIRRVIRENPDAIIAVTGCYAQLKPDEISAIEGVDIVLGNNDKGMLYSLVSGLATKDIPRIHHCHWQDINIFFSAFSSGDRTRTFLKIQDGCDYHCTYCTVPFARGRSRNIPIADVVRQAKEIAAIGQKEIVLTGVNIGDFGRTTGESFAELLRRLDQVKGIERYRISSIEPNLLTDEIIDFCAGSHKFQPHFHIPLQSGCDHILALMGRRYDTALFAERIDKIRSIMPDAFIGIDVITGFPGEREEDFETTYNFLETTSPAFLHIFPYSERPGTSAIKMEGKIPSAVSTRRVKRLGELSDGLHAAFCRRFEGNRARVLVESTIRDGKMYGFTENYVKTEMAADRTLIGEIVDVELAGMLPDGNITARPIQSE